MKTKERIVQSAADLIRIKGYYGTGINEIIGETNIPKGSLYHHFPEGKDSIVQAALEEAAKQLAISFKNAMKGKANACEGLKAVVDLYIKEFRKNGLKYGCPLAAVSLDVSSDNELLRATCSDMFDFWKQAIKSYVEYKGGYSNSDEIAEHFLIQFEGAIMLSRVYKSTKPLELIKKELHKLFE